MLSFSKNEATKIDIPKPVWAVAFGLTPCVAGLAVFRFRNFKPA